VATTELRVCEVASGRHHWTPADFAWFAGGGWQMIGATDEPG